MKSWIYIGSIKYDDIEGDIPEWVLSEEKQIRQKHGGTSSSLTNRILYLKGRTFLYRLTFSGQGGAIVVIDKRLRRKWQHQS